MMKRLWSREQLKKMQKMLSSIRNELWPFKGRQYMLDALDMVESITDDPRQGRWIVAINYALVASTILSVLQYLATDPLHVVLTSDFYGYANLPTNLLVSKTIIHWTCYYFYNILYFKLGKLKCFKHFKDILLYNNRKFVFGSKFNFWGLIMVNLWFCQVLLLSFEVVSFLLYGRFCIELYNYPFQSIGLAVVGFISMTITFIIFVAGSAIFTVAGFAAGVSIICLAIFFERTRMLKQRLLHRPIDRLTMTRLFVHRQLNVITMKYVFELDSRLLGPLLTSFLLTNVPFNISGTTFMIFNIDSLSVHNQLAGYNTIFSQLFVLLLFHFLVAMITHKIHNPYQTLILPQFIGYQQAHRQPCQARRFRTNLRYHLRVANNIEAFHVRRHYGIEYNLGKVCFGLVSLSAFFKFLIIYSEAIFYSFNFYSKWTLATQLQF